MAEWHPDRLQDQLDVDPSDLADERLVAAREVSPGIFDHHYVDVPSGGGPDDQTAAEVSYTPSGDLTATNVQDGMDELESEKQPRDSDLTAIAALTTTSFGRSLLELANAAALLSAAGAQAADATLDTYAGIDPSADVQSVLSAADYAAIRTLLSLVVGTDIIAKSAFDDHSARHEDGGGDEISLAGLAGTSVALQAHLDDSADAHDASAISVADADGNFTGDTVEEVLAELQDNIDAGGGGGTAADDVSLIVHMEVFA